MSARILIGDCLNRLKELPDESVHCVVTSPPYWGLRSYKGELGMIGLEPTFDDHLANLVEVFREVRRVLRKDGTCWLNYGDRHWPGGSNQFGWKAKDRMGMPDLVSTALMRDGWWRREEIIWHKPNPMPESCRDRPTSAHEKLYLLSKAARYFYDAEAVKVPAKYPAGPNSPESIKSPYGQGFTRRSDKQRGYGRRHAGFNDRWDGMTKAEQQSNGANLRNVWTIPTHSFSEAHFATFPPKLVEPCIKAGTSERGVCKQCGGPWVREGVKRLVPTAKAARVGVIDDRDHAADPNDGGSNRQKDGHLPGHCNEFTTTGWSPTCQCKPQTSVPATVLDPFGGSGTVALVAQRMNRDAILCEISPEYAEMARKRIEGDNPMFSHAVMA